jgi:hypothetical protein
MIYPLYVLVLCGVADVKIFLEKEGSGNKPHAEESALGKCLRSTHTKEIKLTAWNRSSKESMSRYKVRKQVTVIKVGRHLRM